MAETGEAGLSLPPPQGKPEPGHLRSRRPRPWRYVGESTYVEGVPFGEVMHTGDYYIATEALWPGDENVVANLVAARTNAEVWERTARLALARLPADEREGELARLCEQAGNEALDAEGDSKIAAATERALRAVLATGDVCSLPDCRDGWCWLGSLPEDAWERDAVRRAAP